MLRLTLRVEACRVAGHAQQPRCCKKCAPCACSLSNEERRGAYKQRTLFQDASLDYIQLQRIQYRAHFRCGCGGRRLTADGISVSNHIARSCQQQPCAADPASPPVAGALFPERLVVRAEELRTPLASYSYSGSDTSKEGLLPADHAAMIAGFSQLPAETHAKRLLPFLHKTAPGRGGRVRAPAPWRDMLYSCSTTSPASALLPKKCFAAAREVIAQGHCSFEGMAALVLRKIETQCIHEADYLPHLPAILFVSTE